MPSEQETELPASYDAQAESIIRCEGLTFALAVQVGREDDLRQARAMLKSRLMKELCLAAERVREGK